MTRTDTRDWARARRERTRHLIELGGLVQKAGLVELVDDDRGTLLGAFLELADRLRDGEAGANPRDLMVRWRRRGLRIFEADKNAAATAVAPATPPPTVDGPAG
jgi:Conjugal transfer protein TraD